MWHAAGCDEVIVKAGARGCFASSAPQTAKLVPAKAMRLIDASGAGDAFNAGYLASRLSGKDTASAIARGQQIAAWVITRKGAVPPNDTDAPYITCIAAGTMPFQACIAEDAGARGRNPSPD